ncbi:Phospho-N-acetylmuramoyl-pentapeptide transferase, conserved site, partial [Dillenia turbinata]
DFDGVSLLDDWGNNEGTSGYVFSSSDGEESDGDVLLNPISDIELPSTNDRHAPSYDSLAVTAHRFAMLAKRRKKRKIKYGILNNVGLIAFLTVLLLLVDLCAWRIVRLPLEPFYLMRPFFISAALASCAGYICVPLLNVFKMHQVLRKTGPTKHSSKKGTPTMGGLFFIPVGITVARTIVGYSSIEVSGAAAVTLGFAAIGLLDDVLSLVKNHNHGLSGWIKILLEVAVGTWFSYWLDATSLSLPYSMKTLVPLPPPLGLVFLGKCYLLLTSFCFVSMGNGVNLTDGLDGLAGGTAALAFIGMSVAVLPLYPDLAVFGASMAGACVGFLLHNRYRASVFMGDTGSLALGGALAAMASCTGMFFPLFVASGVFVLEVLSVIMQISYSKATKHLQGASRRLFRMAPFHHHLELSGIREPFIVTGAYIVTSFLCVLAGYIGLISA